MTCHGGHTSDDATVMALGGCHCPPCSLMWFIRAARRCQEAGAGCHCGGCVQRPGELLTKEVTYQRRRLLSSVCQSCLLMYIHCIQGSGSNIDLCVITKDKVDYIRPHEVANEKGKRFNTYDYPKGTTEVLTETVTPVIAPEDVHPLGAQTMEVTADA
eukprot:TRINITY_DN10251_c0_g2_i1.p2 TRINITY_DN10251_c0_g2~~TRINITY_DN10251_c0_g2_i1.p2  ORF type:complete len:158 (+),score=25.16 TRINITY_DN10251_c0_g2_i1:746-1219(+)